MKRSRQNANSNANAGGGGHGYPAGPPGGHPHHPQHAYPSGGGFSYGNGNSTAVGGAPQQQYSQQPQFRGQWNDYGAKNNNNQQSHSQYSEYSQTQQTQPSQPLDTRRTDHYQHHIRHDTSRSDNPSNYSSQLTNDQSMSQPAGQQPKRLRATKRRLRQPLSGPAGIWFRMNKKEQVKDSKEGIKTEHKNGGGDDATGDDDTFGYDEAGVIAHQAHQAMAEHNRRERERREEEEVKGSGGDDDDIEEMLDEETGQICKVPEGTVSTFEAVLGRAWDVMCICMDRIVPDSSIFVQNHQRQPYHEIRSALDDSPCGKLRHFSLLSESLGRDGPNRDIGIPGSGGALRVGHLVVSIASVHNNNHCDWTVELRDETVTTSPSSSGGRGGRDGDSKGAIGIKGWISEQLLKDHPEWVRPGVVLYLKDAACTVFEAAKTGGLDDIGGAGGAQGGPGGGSGALNSHLSSGNGLERMLLINESSVVCAWLPESHMDRQDFLTLIEKRNTARDARDEIKEEVTDLTQDEKPSVRGVTFKASPPSSRTESNVQPKPSQTELSEVSEVQKMKTSSTQEEEDAAIDLTSDDIGDKENQTKSDAFIAENVESVGDTMNTTTASSPPVIGQGTSTIEATSSGSVSTGSQQESSHRKQQGREALSQEPDRPSGVQGELSQESSTQQEKVCLEKPNMVSNNPHQKLLSPVTPHVSVPDNSTDDPASDVNDTLGGESLPSSLPEPKHTDTTAASSIWAAGVDSGKEETGDDYMFSSGLSSTQDEAFSPMPPSKDTRSSTETGKTGLPVAEESHSAADEKLAGVSVSGIFAGGCCDMLDDLDEDEDDDF